MWHCKLGGLKYRSGSRGLLATREFAANMPAARLPTMQQRSRRQHLVVALAGAIFCSQVCLPCVGSAFTTPGEAERSLSRRAALAVMPLVAAPLASISSVEAREARQKMEKGQFGLPSEEAAEFEAPAEEWTAYTVGESSIVDLNDPKYQSGARLMREIEDEQRRQKEYSDLTPEEKRDRICAALGRGC
mmetsp:Transcript_51428/g.95144  ORF Transcript_51428/g.95144 Transcript_51428/m.95144 type:complete len:189 (+) Transcript_51428:3-569(+)